MGLLSRVKTWVSGEVLTASDLNAEFDNILDSGLVNTKITGSSASVAAMQVVVDPGEVGTESLASSNDGEVKRLRNIIKEIHGGAQWYVTPSRDLSAGSLSIKTADIDNLQVTAAKIANTTITAAQIDTDTITGSQIAANAIGNSELATNAVETINITDGNVSFEKMETSNTQESTASGADSQVGAGSSQIANQSVTITLRGRPVTISLGASVGTKVASAARITSTGGGTHYMTLVKNINGADDVDIATWDITGHSGPVYFAFDDYAATAVSTVYKWDIEVVTSGTITIDAVKTRAHESI